jgi:Fibronectin type 3 domain-containing protein
MRYLKKLLICFLALLQVLTIPAFTVAAPIDQDSSNQTNHIIMTYNFSDPIMGEKDSLGYRNVTVKDLATIADPGNPVLPFKPVKLLIPKGKRIEKINVTLGQQKTLDNVKVKAAASINPTEANYSYSQPNMPIYQSDSPYPSSNYSKPMVQWKSGYQLQFFNLYPVHFIPSQQKITYTDSMKVDISLSDSGSQSSAAHVSALAQDKQIVAHLADNPEALDSYDSEESTPSRVKSQNTDSQTPLLNGKTDYVIITAKDFVNNFTPLMNWKLSKGLSAAIVTVEDIYSKYSGSDHQEQIRNFIKDAYAVNQTKYVLLGGDADGSNVGGESGNNIVPVRKLWAYSSYPSPIPSDLYYACLDGDFDSNKNGIYGEPSDNVDLLAEVNVGRAPVDSAEEVNNFVNKTILYEKSTKEQTAWMLGEKLSEDDPYCSVEMAAKEQNTLSPDQIINTLRELRDKNIKPEYVNFYYENNPYFKQALTNSPQLLASFIKLLVKFTPEFSAYLTGKSDGTVLSKDDVSSILEFSQDLMAEIKKQNIPAENSEAITSQLTQLQTYTNTLAEKSVHDALANSPYISLSAGNALSGETWGGDYKDEIKNGSTTEFTTTGFPTSYKVSTLYDRDYAGNAWPKSEVIDNVLNPGPNLINHMGHANNTYLLKMENADVDTLKNTSPFFLYSQGCYAGAFDNCNPDETYNNQDSIGEHFVCSTNGAFAAIVNSRYGWYTKNDTRAPSQYFDRQFWDAVFGQNIHSLGQALSYSKEMNISYLTNSNYADNMRYCYYEINLLGDPETKLTETEQGKTQPVIISSDPGPDSTKVVLDKTITVKFNKDVITGDDFSKISLLDSGNLPVNSDITLSGNTLTIKPAADLAENTVYTVNIPNGAVKDSDGNQLDQPYSFSFTTGTSGPAGPKGLALRVVSSSEIDLSWNKLQGAKSYNVYQAASEDGTFTQVGSSKTTSFKNTKLQPATSYWYKVKAVTTAGETKFSETKTAATLPMAPSGLKAASESSTAITLSWNKIEGAAYNVYRSTSKKGRYTKVAGALNDSAYNDTNLTPGTTYWYQVSALNADGNESSLSAAVSAVTKIGGPSNLTAKVISNSEIDLSWNKVKSAKSYIVYSAESVDGPYSKVGTSKTASFKANGLQSGKSYWYKVTAVTSAGEGDYSEAVTATTL